MPTVTLNLSETLWNQLQSYRQRRGAALGILVIDERLAIHQLLLSGLAGQTDLAESTCQMDLEVAQGPSDRTSLAAGERAWAAVSSGQNGPLRDGITKACEAANVTQAGGCDPHAGLRRPHFSSTKSLPEGGANGSARHASCKFNLS